MSHIEHPWTLNVTIGKSQSNHWIRTIKQVNLTNQTLRRSSVGFIWAYLLHTPSGFEYNKEKKLFFGSKYKQFSTNFTILNYIFPPNKILYFSIIPSFNLSCTKIFPTTSFPGYIELKQCVHLKMHRSLLVLMWKPIFTSL